MKLVVYGVLYLRGVRVAQGLPSFVVTGGGVLVAAMQDQNQEYQHTANIAERPPFHSFIHPAPLPATADTSG